ncbi:MAG: retropepsin-like domain-containing protein [Verrucomicrobiales bacterium]|nr:retropepsin-like domain-containing protein [Verrucomicrobiales bacterium]
MPTYDAIRFTPPAPLALVTFRNTATGTSASGVPMLLDSGADVSLVPRQAVLGLGVSMDSAAVYELMGFDGRRSSAQAVHLDLAFLSRTFRGRFLLIDHECGILGRDILNHLSLLLDGPNMTWDERTSTAK